MKHLSKIPKHAKKVFTGITFDIYQWEQELYDGSTTTFEAMARADAVAIIPVVDGKLVVLTEQQPGREPYKAFPGGSMEKDELPRQAAIRELYEETGMTFAELRLVKVEDIGGHRVDWNCYRYVATGLLNRDEPHLDPGEKIEVSLLDFDEAKEFARDNIYMSHTIMDEIETLEDLLSLPEVSIS